MKEKTINTITFIRTVQVSPDDWESYPFSIELDDTTTILDIKIAIARELKTEVKDVDLRGMKIGVVHKRH